MQTYRLVNQTWLVFIGSLLGSIFGLMGSVTGLMKLIEIMTEKYERRKVQKAELKSKVLKNLRIREQIVYQDVVKGKGIVKVTPGTLENKDTYCEKDVLDK